MPGHDNKPELTEAQIKALESIAEKAGHLTIDQMAAKNWIRFVQQQEAFQEKAARLKDLHEGNKLNNLVKNKQSCQK